VFSNLIKNLKKYKKILEKFGRCIESNGVQKNQILVHLVFFAGIRNSTRLNF
jgi:hypothetical protein